MNSILRVAAEPATRITDALGREWALKSNGTWAALGHDLTVDSFDELHDRYIVTAVA